MWSQPTLSHTLGSKLWMYPTLAPHFRRGHGTRYISKWGWDLWVMTAGHTSHLHCPWYSMQHWTFEVKVPHGVGNRRKETPGYMARMLTDRTQNVSSTSHTPTCKFQCYVWQWCKLKLCTVFKDIQAFIFSNFPTSLYSGALLVLYPWKRIDNAEFHH